MSVSFDFWSITTPLICCVHVGMLAVESNPNTIIPLFSIHNLYRLITVAKVRWLYYTGVAMRLKGIDEAATKMLRYVFPVQQLKKFKHLT